MATYQFVCRECGTAFEVSCHIEDRESQAVCPTCGSHAVDQQFSAAFSSPMTAAPSPAMPYNPA